LGAKSASGQYVAYLDSDDSYHPNFLEVMHNLILKNSHPGFLWCCVNRVTDKQVAKVQWPSSWHPETAKDPYAYFLKGIYFGTDFGFTVKRECFESVGYFDEKLRVAVDTDFILRIVQHFNFAYTPDILIDTYEHAGERVRKNTLEKFRSYSIIIEKHWKKIQKDKGLITQWYYKLMWLAYHSGNKSEARKYWLYFIKQLRWSAMSLGLLFELLPRDQAVRVHRKISIGKKQKNIPFVSTE
jgi:glycosyltransferase involved in cell wall biosynthesis